MAAPTTEEFSFGNESTVQLANQYDMSQSWTLSVGFTVSPANQTRTLSILSADLNMVKLTAYFATPDLRVPGLYAPGYERLYSVPNWAQGGDFTCTMVYNSDKRSLSIGFASDSGSKRFTADGVDYSGKVLSMFTTELTNPNLGSGWGISGGTFTGEAILPAVPEPTTATLSLLALAGLAARRRRK